MSDKDFGPGLAGWMVVDPTTRAAVDISYEEHRANEAHHFFVADSVSVPVAGTILFTVTTPAEFAPGLRFSVFSRNILCLDIYEGVTNVTGGTPLTSVNNRRDSVNVSALTLKANPTATLPAKLAGFLYDESAGDILSKIPFILKTETTYAITVVPLADQPPDPPVADPVVGYFFRWSE